MLQKDNDKYYIIHKYLNEDVKKLIKMNEITNIIGIMNEIDDDENKNDIDILFGDDVAANKKRAGPAWRTRPKMVTRGVLGSGGG